MLKTMNLTKTELANRILILRGTPDDITAFKVLYNMMKEDLEKLYLYERRKVNAM